MLSWSTRDYDLNQKTPFRQGPDKWIDRDRLLDGLDEWIEGPAEFKTELKFDHAPNLVSPEH